MLRGMLEEHQDATTVIPVKAALKPEETLSVCILGSGTVGGSVGMGLSRFGNKVIFYDVDRERVESLINLGFSATIDADVAIRDSQISFICVPTPTVHGSIDLGYVRSVAREIGKSLRKKADFHLVVVKSTVLPRTTENVVIPLLEKHSRRTAGEDFGVCVNPEFLTQLHHSWTGDRSFARSFLDEPFVVIGELDEKCGDALQEVYEPLKAPVIRTDLRTAEMTKYAFNCALACRISFWNEIFYICRRLNIDSRVVASTAALDERVGTYGAVHGMAFGGKCLPKDLRAFVSFSQESGYEPELLKATEKINARTGKEFGVRE